MQGMITIFKRKHLHFRGLPDIRGVLRRYGGAMLFSLTLAGGLLSGSLFSSGLSESLRSKLDLLFVMNLPSRLRSGALGAFCASFGSGFLFIAAAFLCGLSLWGIAGLPFIAFFKGFGIGVSAGYLFSSYGVKGVFFYLLVLLPGVCVFCTALVLQLSSSLYMCRRMLGVIFKKNEARIRGATAFFLRKTAVCLIMTLLSSLLDVLLWYALSGVFIK